MTMIDGYDITNTGLMFVADGRPFSVDSTHPNYSDIRHALLTDADGDAIVALADARVLIEGQTFGLVTVGNDAVWYKTQQLNGWLIDKLLRMIKDGIDITPWANLLDNLMKNPDPRVHERLPLFLEEAQMPITMDGHFLSWRLVKDDYWDVYTGNTFHCTPGAVISMDRWKVDSDPDATCSAGIHVAAFGYLDNYGFDDSGRRCMLVKTSPEYVVAVPTDYSNRKMRVCQTVILREVDKALVPALFGRDDHVADNNGFVEEDKEFSLDLYDDELLDDELAEAELEALAEMEAEDEGEQLQLPKTPRQPRKKVTRLPPYYVEHDGQGWAVFNRKTGNLRKTLPSREKAREYARRLNRR